MPNCKKKPIRVAHNSHPKRPKKAIPCIPNKLDYRKKEKQKEGRSVFGKAGCLDAGGETVPRSCYCKASEKE